MNKIKYMSGIVLLLALALVSCSDKPSAENYSTFTARMMSDYLKEFPEYSYFTEIIDSWTNFLLMGIIRCSCQITMP